MEDGITEYQYDVKNQKQVLDWAKSTMDDSEKQTQHAYITTYGGNEKIEGSKGLLRFETDRVW